MLKVNGEGGFALKVDADLFQEATVDEETLRTLLLARIGLMSRQHQSTSDEVQLIAGPEEFGGGATELLPWKKAYMLVGEVLVGACHRRRPRGDGRRRCLAAAAEEGREGRGGVTAGRCRGRRPGGEGRLLAQAAADRKSVV